MKKNYNKGIARVVIMSFMLSTSLTMQPVKASMGQVSRIGDSDRYKTAAKIATTNWTTSKDIVLVCGEGYADAISSVALAKKLNAPILLTNGESLNSDTEAALGILKPTNIYVIGGTASVAQSVREQLKSNRYKLIELSGKNRYETNIEVAKKLMELGVKADDVMLVGGEGFSDALSVAPIAAAKGQILLLGNNNADSMKSVMDFVKSNNSKVTVVGTENVINDATYRALGATNRVDGGQDRFDTNLKVLASFKDAVKMDKLYVANATGDGYADALVASALAGKFTAPLVLVDTEGASATTKAVDYIKKNATKATELKVVGGTGVVSDTTVKIIKDTANPSAPSTGSSTNTTSSSSSSSRNDHSARGDNSSPENENPAINAKIEINEVSFPDPIFRKMVEEFDKDKDGSLSYEEIKLVEELDFKQNRKVKSVKGIENFTELKKLNATRTSITEIDLSKNTKLIDVDVSWYLRPCQKDDGKGFIKNIDVSMLKNLKKLNIAGNTELESVDLKNNKYLEYLDIGFTKIYDIYIEDKEDLKILKATQSKIKSLNISNNKKLEELDLSDCSYTFDKNLDLKENKMLKKLNISSLNLNNLDLSNNVNLEEVDISGNNFGEKLDLSKNQNIVKLNIGRTAIKNIDLSKVSQKIEELDLSNNNEIENLDVSMLPNLKVLKLSYLSSLKKIDLSSNSKLETLDISNTALKNYDISKLSSLKNLNISGTESDLIDVSNNKLLESLECYYNENIKSIDVSNNPNLRILYFYHTSVDSIDVTNNPKLYRLDANHTKLSSIDVTKNTELYALNVEDTQVSTIDVTNNPLLYEVYATNAPITEIDFSKNVDIQHIRVAGTKVKKLDLSNNKKLGALFANGAPIEVIDLTCCPDMWEIYAGGTKDLKEIKLSGLSEIRHLWADNSSIEKIDLSAANDMFTIHLNNTNIKDLDLTGKNLLNTIEVGNTKITHLDLSGKEKLAVLDAHNTNIEELKKFDGSKFPNLNSIDLENAGVESINLENNRKLGMIKLSNNKISYANFSNIEPSKWLERKFDNQKVVVYVPEEVNTLNIKDLGCDPTKVKADTSDNYTYDESTGIVTFKSTDKKVFNYTYDIGITGGRKFKNMTVEITVLKDTVNPTVPTAPTDGSSTNTVSSSNSSNRNDNSSPKNENEVVNIPDAKLKEVINKTLGKHRKADAEITKGEMESIKELVGDDKIAYLPDVEWAEPKDIHDRGIKSIEGLQYAINLEKLDLSENRIKDLTPLKNLTKLTYVELDRNMLGDLTPLSNLTNLLHLNIYNNDSIVDMTPISKLPKLEWLDLHFCNRGKQTVNVAPLGEITTLKMVNLESDLVEDISFAKKLINVEVIGVGANNITDMTPLSDMINKIYYAPEGSYELDEEKTYVGMYGQNLIEAKNINVGPEGTTITIPNPVKGLDEFIKNYYGATAPGVNFLSGQENENILLNYNEEKKEIEITVNKNEEKVIREIKTTIFLDYGKYALAIKLNINQDK